MKLFFATPCYGGQVTSSYANSMIRLACDLERSNVPALWWLPSGESLIPRGRNLCVYEFLKRKDYTHLFFIDADIEFKSEDVRALVTSGMDVCAGAYPKKEIDLKRMAAAIAAGKDPAEYMSAIVINPVDGPGVGMGDFIEVKEAGTGFLCIKREVIERIIEANPQIMYTHDGALDENGKRLRVPRLFHADTVPAVIDDEETSRYLSEDWWFCREWRKLGGRIYLNLAINLGHVGVMTFRASPHQIHDGPQQGMTIRQEDGDRVCAILRGELDPKLETPPTILVDNTAREGALAIWASRRWPGIELHLYEPDEVLRSMLMENLKGYKVDAILHEQPIHVPRTGELVHVDGKLEVAS